MMSWLDIGQMLEVIGFCTCCHFANKLLSWICIRLSNLLDHIQDKTDTPSVTVYIDGVPLSSAERVPKGNG